MFQRLRLVAIAALCASSGAFAADSAPAAEAAAEAKESKAWPDSPASVKVNRRWVDARGKVSDVTWKIESQWRWVPNPDKGDGEPEQIAVVRSWLEIPAEFKVRGLEGSAARFYEKSEAPQSWQDAPFQPAKDTSGVVIDSVASLADVSLKLETAEGKRHETGLILQTEPGESRLSIHPSCADVGVRAVQGGELAGLFAAIYCRKQGDKIEVYVFHSDDVELKIKGAYNRDLRCFVLPLESRAQVEESILVPREVSGEIIRYARTLDEALEHVYGGDLWDW